MSWKDQQGLKSISCLRYCKDEIFKLKTFELIVPLVTIFPSAAYTAKDFPAIPFSEEIVILLTAGLGYLVAGLTVFLRDIPQTVAMILNLWFYLTPIVYPATVIPPAWRVWVFWLNPLTAISEVYRDLILVGHVQHWGEWGVASLMSLLVFFAGLTVYQRLRPAFADVL